MCPEPVPGVLRLPEFFPPYLVPGAFVSHWKAGCWAPFPAARSCCGHSLVLRTPRSSACTAQAPELWGMLLLHHAQVSEAFVPKVSESLHCEYKGSTVSIYFQNNGSSATAIATILRAEGRYWQSQERHPSPAGRVCSAIPASHASRAMGMLKGQEGTRWKSQREAAP